MASLGEVNAGPDVVYNVCARPGGACLTPLPPTTADQLGPNCGFYALKWALDYWEGKLADEGAPIAAAPPARKADQPGATMSLRQIAKESPGRSDHGSRLTYVGELFSAQSMVEVARTAGWRAQAHRMPETLYLRKIYQLIDAGVPAIVPIDVDADAKIPGGGVVGGGMEIDNPYAACPGTFGGENAHWVVIIGWFRRHNTRHLVQMNWGSYWSFEAARLQKSSAQLRNFGSQMWVKERAVDNPYGKADRGELWDATKNRQARLMVRDEARVRTAAFHTAGAPPVVTQEAPIAETWSRASVDHKQRPVMKKFAFFHNVALDLSLQIVEVLPPGGARILSKLDGL